MIKSFGRKWCWLLVAQATLLLTVSPSESRPWHPSPADLAQDYAAITDIRPGGETVFVGWLAAPTIREPPNHQRTRDLLDKYVILGAAHGYRFADGTTKFQQVTTLEARDEGGQPLKLLNTDTMPPTIVRTLAAIQSAFGRTLGAFGQGTQWFVFDSGSVHACREGGMSVLFAGETYTYKTPFPGCL